MQKKKRIVLNYGPWREYIKSVLVSKWWIGLELRLVIHNIAYLPIYCIDLGEFRINIFFTEVQKRILVHCSLKSQIVESELVSKRCFLLSSNLICGL